MSPQHPLCIQDFSTRDDVIFAHRWEPLGPAMHRAACRKRGEPPYLPCLIQSATRSPIIMVVTLVLARMQSGMIEASTTRIPSNP